MDRTGAMGFLAMLGVMMAMLGAIVYNETKWGKVLIGVGILHILPFLFYIWSVVIL